MLQVVASSPCRVRQGLIRVVDITHQRGVCIALRLAVTVGVILPGGEQPGLPDNRGVGLDAYTKNLIVVWWLRRAHRYHCRAAPKAGQDLRMRQRTYGAADSPIEVSGKAGLFPRFGVSALVPYRAVMCTNPAYLSC